MHNYYYFICHTEPTNPLESVRLLNATSRYLVFIWTKVLSNCSLVQYVINASEECGICPNHTSSTQVKCFLSEDITDKLRMCQFKVITAICGGLDSLKSESNMVTANLKCKFSLHANHRPVHNSRYSQPLFTLFSCSFWASGNKVTYKY